MWRVSSAESADEGIARAAASNQSRDETRTGAVCHVGTETRFRPVLLERHAKQCREYPRRQPATGRESNRVNTVQKCLMIGSVNAAYCVDHAV